MFVDKLRVSLTLTVSSGAHDVPAGAIDHVDVDATTYGFEASVSFFVSSEDEDDLVFPDFVADALIKAELSIGSHLLDEDDTGQKLTVSGYVLEKRMSETVSESQANAPVVGRQYWVRFVDAARAFWSQHRPLDLRSAATMSDVLTSYETEGVKVNQDFGALGDTQSVLCIGLPAEGRASFYDFVHWYLELKNGVFELDYGTFQYRIGGAKTKATATTDVLQDDVQSVRVLLPSPPRSTTRILDSSTLVASTTNITGANTVTGVYNDVLLRTPFSSDVEKRKLVEQSRSRAPVHGIEISHLRVPLLFVPPGSTIALGEGFPTTVVGNEKKYRITRIVFHAEAENPDSESDLEDALAPFRASLVVTTELESDPTIRRPPHQRPTYPVIAEGKVVSFGGQPKDRTWMAVPDEDTGVIYVSVRVPLWNTVLVLPFEPNQQPGHFFFPPYKDQRVLLEIGFDEARIHAYLDWADNARQTLDSQGNALVMGKQASDGTAMTHVFTDEKPVFRVERKNAGDNEWMEMSEGIIHFQVQELPGSTTTEPVFDVTLQVEAAKSDVASGVKDAIGDVTESFNGSAAQVNTSIDDASDQINAAVDAAEATLFGKVDAASAQLVAVVGSAAEAVSQVTAAVSAAKAAILGELSS